MENLLLIIANNRDFCANVIFGDGSLLCAWGRLFLEKRHVFCLSWLRFDLSLKTEKLAQEINS